MKKKILVITMAMALILTSACGSKGDSKAKKDKDETTTEATDASKDESTTTAPKETTEDVVEFTTEATTESTTEATTEETTTAPVETSERDESECIFDLSSMTAEEIADLCDSLWTTRERPKVGDKLTDVQKTYFDVEPWRYLGMTQLQGRYGKSDKDNVQTIYVCGVNPEQEYGEPEAHIKSIDHFGTGLVIEIYDTAKAEEFLKIMKERHPVIEQKPDGSWRSDDFVLGMTPVNLSSYDGGYHLQIAYGEKSIWYESVYNIFGFGLVITVPDPTESSESTNA
ncbi:MAG: hypothetical protein IKR22_03695 [Clostridiales bacterium]|nr:hypothetical protein [Clostridiales bacterium]